MTIESMDSLTSVVAAQELPSDGPSIWNSVVISSRETITALGATIEALLTAQGSVIGTVDIIVNGNAGLAKQLAECLPRLRRPPDSRARIRVWYLKMSDKAHAMNEYVHTIWPGEGLAFFVDGYARVAPGALSALADALAKSPEALAASGVPSMGRSARRLRSDMSRQGGIHGNLFVLTASTTKVLRRRGFRLPLGLYRTDPVLGAVLCFAFDPAVNEWKSSRIVVEPDATWAFEPLRWWHPTDWRTQWRRVQRQAQGSLENLAVRNHLAELKAAPERMPRTASALVANWLEVGDKAAVRKAMRAPIRKAAWQRMNIVQDWSAAEVPPALLATVEPSG